MIGRLIAIMVVVCCTSGCAALSPWAMMSSDSAEDGLTGLFATSRQANTGDAPLMVSLNRSELEFDILPIGSYVSVECEEGCKYEGTIVHRTKDYLQLVNCLRMSMVDDDHGQLQRTTQCMPLQIVEKPIVTRVTVMSLPSPKFDPHEMKFEKDDTEVMAVEFHSGRVQRWSEPQVKSEFNRDNHSPEEMIQAMENVQPGSQIAFVDTSGERFNAIVLSTPPQKVNLRCRARKEAIEGRDGHQAICFSVLPICSIGVESISKFDVVAPPPADFDAAEFDSGCDLCIADVIYKSGRRQSQWKLARDDARMSKFFDKKARPLMERNLANAPTEWRVE